MSGRRLHPYGSAPGGSFRDGGDRRGGAMRTYGGSYGGYSDAADRKDRERPSRTLFVRNIQYEVPEKLIKDMLDGFGEIKSFFNLIQKRGLAFATYYDVRSAERAKKDLQSKEINGRLIDVHFAIPKEDDPEFMDDKNTGTLFISLRNVTSPVNNDDIKSHFEQWGGVKDVRECKNSPNQKFVEFYDLRDCAKAFEQSLNGPFMEGTLDVKHAFSQKKDGKPDTPRPESTSSRGGRRDYPETSTYNYQGMASGYNTGYPPVMMSPMGSYATSGGYYAQPGAYDPSAASYLQPQGYGTPATGNLDSHQKLMVDSLNQYTQSLSGSSVQPNLFSGGSQMVQPSAQSYSSAYQPVSRSMPAQSMQPVMQQQPQPSTQMQQIMYALLQQQGQAPSNYPQ